jgi:hypothetical protein
MIFEISELRNLHYEFDRLVNVKIYHLLLSIIILLLFKIALL